MQSCAEKIRKVKFDLGCLLDLTQFRRIHTQVLDCFSEVWFSIQSFRMSREDESL